MKNTSNKSGDSVKTTNKKKRISEEIAKLVEIYENKDLSIPKNLRRLDSLARLLEGNSICAAVYFDGNKILVASNKLHATSQETNQAKEFIRHVLEYCEEYASSSIEQTSQQKFFNKRLNVFQNICIHYIRGQMAQAGIASYDGYIKRLAEHILNSSGDPLHYGKKITLGDFEKIIGTEVRDAKVGMLFGAAIVSIPRLARDFKKVEYYLKSNNVIKNPHQVIQVGKNLHAEMQIIQYIKDEGIDYGYIGISKLCCIDCASVITAINIQYNQEEYGNECAGILNRGSHNIDFGDKWNEPDFLSEDNDLKKLYINVKKYLSSEIQKTENTGHNSMLAETSDSPPPKTKSEVASRRGFVEKLSDDKEENRSRVARRRTR